MTSQEKRELYVNFAKELAKKHNLYVYFELILDPNILIYTFAREGKHPENDIAFPKYRIKDIYKSDIHDVARYMEKWLEDDLLKIERTALNDKPLESCPFCGGEAEIRTESESDGHCRYSVKFVECTECGVRTKKRVCDGYYELWCSDKEIAELWNRRIKKGE